MADYEIIVAGNCIACGRKIKIITNKKNKKYPNILFCPRCDERRLKKQKESEE